MRSDPLNEYAGTPREQEARHPHERVCPPLRWLPSLIVVRPQSQAARPPRTAGAGAGVRQNGEAAMPLVTHRRNQTFDFSYIFNRQKVGLEGRFLIVSN